MKHNHFTDKLIASVEVHIDANKPISAIKRLRELFPDMGLKEAHDNVRFNWEKFKQNWRA